jgi:isoquinoline 1-oxidoreductase beta subunit
MPTAARLDRRDFLNRTAAGTSGLLIGFYLSGKCETPAGLPPKDSTPINAWVQIAPHDSVTVLIDKSEMGQASRPLLP